LNKKRPEINDETVYGKLVSKTKILELGRLGTFLYKTKYTWEHKVKNCCRMGKKEKYCKLCWSW
jgi:hypothetical protein